MKMTTKLALATAVSWATVFGVMEAQAALSDRIERFAEQFSGYQERANRRLEWLQDRSLDNTNPHRTEKLQELIEQSHELYTDTIEKYLTRLSNFEARNTSKLTDAERERLYEIRRDILRSQLGDDPINLEPEPETTWGTGLQQPPTQSEVDMLDAWAQVFYRENSLVTWLYGGDNYGANLPGNQSLAAKGGFPTARAAVNYVESTHPVLQTLRNDWGSEYGRVAVVNYTTGLSSEPATPENWCGFGKYTPTSIESVVAPLSINEWADIWITEVMVEPGRPKGWCPIPGSNGIRKEPISLFSCDSQSPGQPYQISTIVPVDASVTLLVDVGTIGEFGGDADVVLDPMADGQYDAHTVPACEYLGDGLKRCEATIDPAEFNELFSVSPGGLPLGTEIFYRLHQGDYGNDYDAVSEETGQAKGCIVFPESV